MKASPSATEERMAAATGLCAHPDSRISPSESSSREGRAKRVSPQIGVTLGRFGQESDVVAAFRLFHARKAVPKRDFGACDGLDVHAPCGVSELHGAVEAVVVGEREGGVAKLGCSHGQFFRVRCAVQE